MNEDLLMRQRMMAHVNKWKKRIMMRHSLMTSTISHCTLHQVLFSSPSYVLKCDGIFTPKELGAPFAD
jgi:ribosomal protein S27E